MTATGRPSGRSSGIDDYHCPVVVEAGDARRHAKELGITSIGNVLRYMAERFRVASGRYREDGSARLAKSFLEAAGECEMIAAIDRTDINETRPCAHMRDPETVGGCCLFCGEVPKCWDPKLLKHVHERQSFQTYCKHCGYQM